METEQFSEQDLLKATFSHGKGFSAVKGVVSGDEPNTPAMEGGEPSGKKAPRTVKRKTPDVTPMLLTGDTGLQELMDDLKSLNPRLTGRRGKEKSELDLVLSKYIAWAKDIRPQMHFETFMAKCEKLSGNTQVQNKLVDLRNMSSSKQFDDLLAQHERQMYGEEEETDQHIEQQEQPATSITQEQRDKAEQSKLKAMRIRREKEAERQRAEELNKRLDEEDDQAAMIAAQMEEEERQRQAQVMGWDQEAEEAMMDLEMEINENAGPMSQPATEQEPVMEKEPSSELQPVKEQSRMREMRLQRERAAAAAVEVTAQPESESVRASEADLEATQLLAEEDCLAATATQEATQLLDEEATQLEADGLAPTATQEATQLLDEEATQLEAGGLAPTATQEATQLLDEEATQLESTEMDEDFVATQPVDIEDQLTQLEATQPIEEVELGATEPMLEEV